MKKLHLLLPVLINLATAIQPSARDPLPNQQFRDLKWGQLNFLHTTDNHGWHAGHLQEPQYSADFGDYISFVKHMRRLADEKEADLVVVDTGDRAEGNGLWDASDPKGNYTRNFYHKLDIDVITNGNHELYNKTTAQNEFDEMIPYYNGKYVASNVDIDVEGKWEPFANRSHKLVTKNLGLKITSFGFLFNFTGNYNNTRVKAPSEVIKEDWFHEAISDKDVDLFMVIGHIDVEDHELGMVLAAIREINPDTPVQIFGGHSHLRKFVQYDDKSTALESGRYFETVGFLSIDGLATKAKKAASKLNFFRRYIDANRVGYQHHTGANEDTFDTPEGLEMSAELTKYRAELGLDRLIGCAPQDWSLNKDMYGSPNNWYTFLEETVLPKVVTNKDRHDVPRIIFINTGSQRFDVFKGPFTYDTSFLVSPFTSKFRFAPNVPWEYASQLREYFEDDSNPYFHTLGGPEREGPRPQALKSNSFRVNQRQQNVLVNGAPPTIVPGYTTRDDFGDDGDDTVHSRIIWHFAPKVIQGNASFPDGWETSPPETVDVVFMDFIGWNVAAGLNEISGNDSYRAVDFQPYMGEEDTMTKLLLDYVEKEWRHDCV
ncbi:uncharacterized protein H6S33_009873 [Morchella sextelata]|nr:uncharacterized protein H6S33_009873 [Morchella sextelata]KAH0602263.1 hypothetical protein H6S33_009873 [Morchella sextelata]